MPRNQNAGKTKKLKYEKFIVDDTQKARIKPRALLKDGATVEIEVSESDIIHRRAVLSWHDKDFALTPLHNDPSVCKCVKHRGDGPTELSLYSEAQKIRELVGSCCKINGKDWYDLILAKIVGPKRDKWDVYARASPQPPEIEPGTQGPGTETVHIVIQPEENEGDPDGSVRP